MTSWKKIIGSLLALAVCLWAYSWFMETGIRNNRNYKPGYILNNPINADVVFLGACEPEWDILPDSFSLYSGLSSYTLAQFAADYAENYLMMRAYISKQSAPRLVAIFATPESFDSSIANNFNSYRFAHLPPDDTIFSTIKSFDPDYARWYGLPFMRYSWYANHTFFKSVLGWADRVKGNRIPIHPGGTDIFPIPFIPGKTPVMVHGASVRHFTWCEKRASYFARLIQYLRSRNIPVLLYESPLWKKGVELRPNHSEILAKIDSIAACYKVPYKRFENAEISADSANFYTVTNLSSRATGWFNRELGIFLRDSLRYLYPGEFK